MTNRSKLNASDADGLTAENIGYTTQTGDGSISRLTPVVAAKLEVDGHELYVADKTKRMSHEVHKDG